MKEAVFNKKVIFSVLLIIVIITVLLLMIYIKNPKKMFLHDIFNNCSLRESLQDKKVYIVCDSGGRYSTKYEYKDDRWEIISQRIFLDEEYKFLSSDEIKEYGLENIIVGIKDNRIPIKTMLENKNDNNGELVGIGIISYGDNNISDEIVIKFFENSKDYTFYYKLNNGSIFYGGGYYLE